MTSRAIGFHLALLACASCSTVPQSARAQDLSGKPIRLIVGLSAGGGDRRHGAPGRAEDEREPAHDRPRREQSRRQFHSGAARAHQLAARRPHAVLHLDQLADHPAAAPGLSVRSHQAHPGHPGGDRTADPGRAQRSRGQERARADRLRQQESGQAPVRRRRRHRQLALSRDRAAEGQDRHQGDRRALPRRGARAQRSPRRAHRCDVRCDAGDGPAGQDRQGHAAGGDRQQALVRSCPMCRPSWRPA